MAITDKNKPTLERLKELKSLYDAGILTKEEMEAEKDEILGKETSQPEQSSPEQVHCDNKNEIQEESRGHETAQSPSPWTTKRFVIVIAILIAIIAVSILSVKSCNPKEANGTQSIDDITLIDSVGIEGNDDEAVGTTSDRFEYIHIKIEKGIYTADIEWPKSITSISDISHLQKCIARKVFNRDCTDIKTCVDEYFDGCVEGLFKLKFLGKNGNIFGFHAYIEANTGANTSASDIQRDTYIYFEKDLNRALNSHDITNDYASMLNIVNNNIPQDEHSEAGEIPDNFRITDTGITFIFDAGGIAAYYQGQSYIKVSYEELNDVLSPAFKGITSNDIKENDIEKVKKLEAKEVWEEFTYTGTMTDESGDWPFELSFEQKGREFRNCIYKNVTYGGKIRMKGEFSEDDYGSQWIFTGKDGSNTFQIQIHLYCMEGLAKDGSKEMTVALYRK